MMRFFRDSLSTLKAYFEVRDLQKNFNRQQLIIAERQLCNLERFNQQLSRHLKSNENSGDFIQLQEWIEAKTTRYRCDLPRIEHTFSSEGAGDRITFKHAATVLAIYRAHQSLDAWLAKTKKDSSLRNA